MIAATFNFSDIFKSKFLENATTNFSVVDTLLSLGLSFLIGLFIFLVYKKTFNGVMYARNFNLSLVALSMVTSLVISAVTSNVVLSLGMVGALSIVRFRTAIKDPMDIVYLFWAIAAGIVTGAGLYLLAISGSLILGGVLFLFSSAKQGEDPYVLVASLSRADAEDGLMEILGRSVRRQKTKCKAVYPDGRVELTIEVRFAGRTDFIGSIAAVPGVESVSLVSYSGELSA
ncbi:MAG: DUF4956 domain-containing protein [Clostridia bacterium]|nr:DUF4956 domain-containing protein [Clostridia bacterium]